MSHWKVNQPKKNIFRFSHRLEQTTRLLAKKKLQATAATLSQL